MSASSALRPIFQIVPLQEHVKTASSMLVLDMDEMKFGVDGALFLADCGVIPEPTDAQLADIAVTTADIAGHLTGELPRVALWVALPELPVISPLAPLATVSP